MVRDVCNELRSGLMLVAQASAKEQIKAFDSQGAQCVCVCVCVCVCSVIWVLMNHTLLLYEKWEGSRSTCVGLRWMTVQVTRNLPEFA
jgi:hypothetical protein